MSVKLGRRTLLQGLGGVAVGLPLLECMMGGSRKARAQSAAPITRYAIVFAGQALGGDGWERDRYQVAGTRKQESGHFIVPQQVADLRGWLHRVLPPG